MNNILMQNDTVRLTSDAIDGNDIYPTGTKGTVMQVYPDTVILVQLDTTDYPTIFLSPSQVELI